MAKGIALTLIQYGVNNSGDAKNNIVTTFNPGDELDLPDDVIKALCEAKAAEMKPGFAKSKG